MAGGWGFQVRVWPGVGLLPAGALCPGWVLCPRAGCALGARLSLRVGRGVGRVSRGGPLAVPGWGGLVTYEAGLGSVVTGRPRPGGWGTGIVWIGRARHGCPGWGRCPRASGYRGARRGERPGGQFFGQLRGAGRVPRAGPRHGCPEAASWGLADSGIRGVRGASGRGDRCPRAAQGAGRAGRQSRWGGWRPSRPGRARSCRFAGEPDEDRCIRPGREPADAPGSFSEGPLRVRSPRAGGPPPAPYAPAGPDVSVISCAPGTPGPRGRTRRAPSCTPPMRRPVSRRGGAGPGADPAGHGPVRPGRRLPRRAR